MSYHHSTIRVIRGALSLTVALMVSTIAVPTPAFAKDDLYTETPPPPLRSEVIPPARDGYVWGAGHWEWNGRAYAWISGTWIVERRAARWVAGRWEQEGDRWHFIAGHWER